MNNSDINVSKEIALLRNRSRTNILSRMVAAMRNWQEHRMALHQLQSMSDHHLRDIGINRSDIEYAVKHGRLPRSRH